MLINLEKIKKLETASENLLKRIFKVYLEVEPEKNLSDQKLTSNVGPKKVDQLLKKFEWDDVKFPRSSSLFDQIKHLQEKLQTTEKSLKLKQQNYHDSKVIIQTNFQKKDTLTNFVNHDLNDTVLQLLKDRSRGLKADLFVRSENLCSFIVFLPKQLLPKFLATYELQDDFILPGSFTQLTERHGLVMGNVVGFRRSEDNIKLMFKQEYQALTKPFSLDVQRAEQNFKKQEQIVFQNKSDKELLVMHCVQSYVEVMLLMIHIKLYLVIIDSSLRFGSLKNFSVILIFFEHNKKARIISKLIQNYAEKDKLEFYGTKDQLQDVEDFFPFVWSDLKIE
jgi:V-type H+-transporting ATPase subunit C